MELIKFIFSSFWVFFGTVIILAGFTAFLIEMYRLRIKHSNILKNGYPPDWCDAEGNLKGEEEEG